MNTIESMWNDWTDEMIKSNKDPPNVITVNDADGCDFLVFDIETGPQDDEALKAIMPEFVAPPPPGKFDESAVKLGNMKDPAKIKEKIEKARADHAAEVAAYAETVATARAEQWTKFVERAALDATTGRVVAIGMFLPEDKTAKPWIIDCDGDGEHEEAGLRSFWAEIEACLAAKMPMVGFNTHHFDLPFLVRRSWILGVPIPAGVRVGRYFSPLFVDLMRVWALDGRDMIGLDTLAKAFGLPGKVTEVEVNGEKISVSGAEFAKLWKSHWDVAKEYLARDLEIPAKLASLMGAV